ncbi:calcium-binding protein [Novilysobacter antarcticus]|uniref:calcium-binding protein n=1 Tax=Novilysobacter antarcticus TaxID=2862543 RepID=UPI001C99A4A8|nr:calcium-binding protein [Lysobacter antarcticus]
MADQTQTPPPLKKFVYPFRVASTGGKAGSAATEVVDPQTYYSALASAEDGFYPIGANGQWHGGVHFGSQTGATLAQDEGIRCIADGEVIAYRIDGTYPKVAYDSCGEATYSTGFALVRHRLQLPPASKTTESAPIEVTGSGAASTNEAKEPSLTFYSLYMHLHHWKGYQDDAKKPRPAYWGDTVYEVAESAADADRFRNPHIPEGGIGLNLRDADGKIAGFAPRGVKLRLGDQGNKAGYYAVTGVESGEVVPAGLTGAYAYKKELTETPVDPTPNQVVVLDTPFAVKAGDLMGLLGQYQRHVDTNPLGSSCSKRPLVQLDVFSGDDVEGFIAKSRERAKLLDEKHKTLLLIEAGATLASPAKADQQIVANDGITLDTTSPKTGAWAKVRKGPMEVVGKDSLSGYDKATRTYGNGSVLSRILDADGNAIALDAYNALTDKSAYTRREVMVPTGDPVWVQRSMLDDRPLITGRTMDAWSRFPLQAGDTTGPRAAWPRVVPLKNLEMTAVEADGTRWWQVDVGTAEGSGRSGWAREKDQTKVTLCTPWDWPGFELVKADDTPPATFYANHVAKQPRTPKDEQGTLAAQGASAESAPLFQSLYDVIDVDGDKKLTATEIRKALKQPWLAQAISRLITRYDSEWAGPMDKWDAIDPLVPEPRKADWVQEKKRIESLLWWDKIEDLDYVAAYHFHSVGLITNFLKKTECACGSCLGNIFSSTRYGKQYGPVYWGTTKLADYADWESLIISGSVTPNEREILVAMSENEGKMDAIQSYDSEVLTAGAMQKTINPLGAGEFPIQVYEFQQEHPDLYQSLFAECGWEVKIVAGKKHLYYDGKTGGTLKRILRDGFDQNSFKSRNKSSSKPLAAIVHAISTDEYKAKQVIDFVKRLRSANSLSPNGYAGHIISNYIHSNLGKAVVLDHHVNRPGYVARDFGAALTVFFAKHPTAPADPSAWGKSHVKYESTLLDIYGNSRVMTDASSRYRSLKSKL